MVGPVEAPRILKQNAVITQLYLEIEATINPSQLKQKEFTIERSCLSKRAKQMANGRLLTPKEHHDILKQVEKYNHRLSHYA